MINMADVFAKINEMRKEVESGRCPICHKTPSPEEFRDELSVREHQISGFCQKCQDDFFGEVE